MKSLVPFASPTVVFVAAMVVLPADAGAQYLDPGAGSILVQAVVAVAVGVSAVTKMYWGQISAFFSRRKKRDRKP